METLFERNPLDACRGRGTCGHRRVTPTQRRKLASKPLLDTWVPLHLTVRITEIDTPYKKDDGLNQAKTTNA